jgi:CRISPR-associated protein Csd1
MLALAVSRIQKEISKPSKNNKKEGEIYTHRLALIKAFLNRNSMENHGMALNSTLKDPAYVLGRLFNMCERVQDLVSTHGSLRKRFFTGASTHPASIFPTILQLHGHHLAQLEKNKPALSGWFSKQIEEILALLEISQSALDVFPCSLSLEQQGRFYLGYYHQQHFKEPKPSHSSDLEMENL